MALRAEVQIQSQLYSESRGSVTKAGTLCPKFESRVINAVGDESNFASDKIKFPKISSLKESIKVEKLRHLKLFLLL